MSIRPGRPPAAKRRTQARRAAVAVLGGLAVFAALQLGFAVAIEAGCFPECRDPYYGTRLARLRSGLRAAPEKPVTVVMVGSSRTQHGFLPRGWQGPWGEALGRPVAGFNFGIPLSGPRSELLFWNRLRHAGVRPDLLLVEVAPLFLSDASDPRELSEERLPTGRLCWQDLPLVERFAGNLRTGDRGRWLQSWPFPWYTHRFSLVSMMKPSLLPDAYRVDSAWGVDESGGARILASQATPEWRRRAKRLVLESFQPSVSSFHLGGPPCDALRELLASCRQDGVPAALVVMPEGPSFRNLYPPEAWPEVQAWLEQLSREYDAPLVNAREWIDEDDFVDSHHLMAPGADKFMERLGRECILPLLTQAKYAPP